MKFTITLEDDEVHQIRYALQELASKRYGDALDHSRFPTDYAQACRAEAVKLTELASRFKVPMVPASLPDPPQ